jgi:hypothetical protein
VTFLFDKDCHLPVPLDLKAGNKRASLRPRNGHGMWEITMRVLWAKMYSLNCHRVFCQT